MMLRIQCEKPHQKINTYNKIVQQNFQQNVNSTEIQQKQNVNVECEKNCKT